MVIIGHFECAIQLVTITITKLSSYFDCGNVDILRNMFSELLLVRRLVFAAVAKWRVSDACCRK